MPELFEKTSIKSLDLPNRSVRSATWSAVGDDKGYVTDRAIEFYTELAGGEIGLIITGYQYVLPNGIQHPYMLGNYDDDMIEGLSGLARAVHSAGGKIVPQIVHTGARANAKLFPKGWEVWGPSAVPDPVTNQIPKEVTRREINLLIEAYAAAARRSKVAGFDGVQLHAAHGYGINQFLSPAYNHRGDAYGGPIGKRYRFPAEVLEAVRGEVGGDFPILIKLNAHDFLDKGLVPEDSIEVARRLTDDGIDAIEISAGSTASPEILVPARKGIKTEEDEAYLADLVATFRSAVSVPIITVGGIRSPSTITGILSESKADYVSMSRPFIREPHLIKRWKLGDAARAACISCNGCYESGLDGGGIFCVVERKLKDKRSNKQG